MARSVPKKLFSPDYDDPRDGKPETAPRRAVERAEVLKQARHLANLRNDPDFFRSSVRLLQQRRIARDDLVEFEAVPNDGIDALVVPGELLARREHVATRAVRELIDDLDLKVEELPDRSNPTGKLVRLVEKDRATSRLRGRTAEITGHLRAPDVRGKVSVRYVCPLGGVIKGEGGPEPSTGGRRFPERPGDLSDVMVAVVDTGISAEERTDGWLQKLVRDDNEDLLDAIPVPDGVLDLGAGHGTFVAGAVQQVAPHATLHVERAMDTDGIGTDDEVAAAILRAADAGATIINLSLGTQTLDDEPPLALQVALETLFDGYDAVVVAAAGNYGDPRPCWPAAFSSMFPGRVVAVGGLTASGAGAPWSTHGGWVTCSVVGEGVVSTYVIGTEDVRIDYPPDTFGPNSWATWTGTSFAAPQVAGALARWCQAVPGRTAPEAVTWLKGEGTPLTGYGRTMILLPGT